MFLLIREAVRRYGCDGIELDFNRFPIPFKGGTTAERILKMNEFLRRLRGMLDAEGKKWKRHLVLGVRPPTENYDVPATYQRSRKVGCDPVAWARNGWIDFVTVSRFLNVTFDLPVAPWKETDHRGPRLRLHRDCRQEKRCRPAPPPSGTVARYGTSGARRRTGSTCSISWSPTNARPNRPSRFLASQ